MLDAALSVILLSVVGAQNCILTVPFEPLSAAGLARLYTVQGCNQADATSFVEGVIFDPATNRLSVYNPLVVNAGDTPAIAPVAPVLPPNAVVGLWFGTNGDSLTLAGPNLNKGKCINGIPGSIFGQFANCNGRQFFGAASAASPPPLGKAADGQTCLTTRDFALVDMDQSDNVITTYLLSANKKLAQNTAANRQKLKGAEVLANGSDNRLLLLLDQALKCSLFTAPDLADPGQKSGALALNELQAAKFQAAPAALVPSNDPMVTVNGAPNQQKLRRYREGVNQDPNASSDPKLYCQNYANIAPPRFLLDQRLTQGQASPDADAANNLFNFLCSRFETSFGADGLNCAGLLGIPSPVVTTTNAAGVATACKITPLRAAAAQPAANNVPAGGPKQTTKGRLIPAAGQRTTAPVQNCV